MVGTDGEVGWRRPRLDLLVRAMGEDPVRETLDVSGEDWGSILSGGMELDERLLARLEKMVGAAESSSTWAFCRPEFVLAFWTCSGIRLITSPTRSRSEKVPPQVLLNSLIMLKSRSDSGYWVPPAGVVMTRVNFSVLLGQADALGRPPLHPAAVHIHRFQDFPRS